MPQGSPRDLCGGRATGRLRLRAWRLRAARRRPEPRPQARRATKMAAGGDRGTPPVPMATAAYRCPLCRRSAFSGRRSHLYSAGHQRRLRAVLARLRERVAAAQKTLKRAAVVPYDPGEHEQPFWCVCCEQEVKQHLSYGMLTAVCSGVVEHLASPEHKKAVCTFWWKNKADPNLKSQFLITSEDYELFKASLTKALDAYEARNDEVIQQMAAHIRRVEHSRQEMVQAISEVCVPRKPGGTSDGDGAVPGRRCCHDLYRNPKRLLRHHGRTRAAWPKQECRLCQRTAWISM